MTCVGAQVKHGPNRPELNLFQNQVYMIGWAACLSDCRLGTHECLTSARTVLLSKDQIKGTAVRAHEEEAALPR
ncbi:hypothetical protein HMPREF9695_04236 [Afipia broomeae ATCC 49717]|uniref:Uncharacterized protein n=1 Tax=Afipia broomeae ATCC 49717 TaxID=883078 RepID=K8NYR5_9BRAD|nr:hypothetical protein HMPREF9695_04236 [Afipia broomeae ATCC 49717]